MIDNSIELASGCLSAHLGGLLPNEAVGTNNPPSLVMHAQWSKFEGLVIQTKQTYKTYNAAKSVLKTNH